MDLGALAQRAVVGPQLGEVGERLVERVGRVEVRVGRGRVRAEQVVVVVRADLAREHVLPGVLVAAVAGEALLVAVVDDRLAAGEEHQLVRELVAGEQLGVGGAGIVGARKLPMRPMSWLPRKVGRL